MAVANKITYWNGVAKPCIGSIVLDHATQQCKVFNGTHWIAIDYTFLLDNNMTDLQEMLGDAERLTDLWIESQYPDLKEMRKQHQESYKTLSDKYRVFEILKRSGEENEN